MPLRRVSLVRASRTGRCARALVVAVVAATRPAAHSLEAQVSVPDLQDTTAISAADIARHLHAITDGSPGGRDTPSPGLDSTAAYLVAEFKRLGLVPGVEGGGWIERYNLPGHYYLDFATTRIDAGATFERRGSRVVQEDGGEPVKQASFSFATTASPAMATADLTAWNRTSWTPPPTVLVAGRHTAQSIRAAKLQNWQVVYVPPNAADSNERRQVLEALYTSSSAVLVVAAEDSASFVRRQAIARQRPVRLIDDYMSMGSPMGPNSWAAYVWLPALQQVLDAVGVDARAAQADTTQVVRKLAMSFVLSPGRDTTTTPSLTAPNVVAALEGRDSRLKNQYIAIAAHMDYAGPRGDPGDNAAGVAGLLALAKAFSRPEMRPRRSLLFLATSGGAKDWWGMRFFASTRRRNRLARNVVASLHLDAIDRITGDSLVVDGVQDFAGRSPEWAIKAHPELGLTVIDGGSIDRSPANQGAFIQPFSPSMSVRQLDDRGRGGRPGPATLDAVRLARVLRLTSYLVRDLDDAERRPTLSEEARRRTRQSVAGD